LSARETSIDFNKTLIFIKLSKVKGKILELKTQLVKNKEFLAERKNKKNLVAEINLPLEKNEKLKVVYVDINYSEIKDIFNKF